MDILTELNVAGLALEVTLTVVLKASLVLMITWLIARFLKHKSASLRHTFWATAFISLLMLPLLALALPKWGALVHLTATQPEVEYHVFNKESVVREVRVDHNSAIHLDGVPTEINAVAPQQHVSPAAALSTRPEIQPSQIQLSWASGLGFLVLFVWFIGAVTLLYQVGLHYLHTRRLTKSAGQAANLARDYKLSASIPSDHVRILYSDRIVMPMTWGVHRPVIMLPLEANWWPEDRLRSVVLHEFAHVQRKDYLTFIGMQIVCALYWFNPFVWKAARRLVFEQERACDDKVLQFGIKPSAYATHLLDIAQRVRSRPDTVLRALSMAGPLTLKERMHAILNGSFERTAVTRQMKLLVSCLTLAITTPLAGLTSCKTESPAPVSPVQEWTVALTDPSPLVRKKAAWALGNLESIEALDPLIKRLSDQDDEVRGMVAWALGEIKDRRAVPALINALSDDDEYDRERIVMALGEIEDTQAIEPLVQQLNADNEGVRMAAAWALGEISEPAAIQALAAAVPSADLRTREAIIRALGKARSSNAVPHLIAAFEDGDTGIRKVAIAAAFLTRSTLIIEPLLDMLQNDASHEVRAMIVEHIWVFRSPASLEGIITALGDNAPEVRERSAWALGKLRDARAVDALIQTLRDDDADVRAMAVWALDEIQLP